VDYRAILSFIDEKGTSPHLFSGKGSFQFLRYLPFSVSGDIPTTHPAD